MTKYTFTLSEQQANLILMALGELPAKHSMELIAELQRQAAATKNPSPPVAVEAQKADAPELDKAG